MEIWLEATLISPLMIDAPNCFKQKKNSYGSFPEVTCFANERSKHHQSEQQSYLKQDDMIQRWHPEGISCFSMAVSLSQSALTPLAALAAFTDLSKS